MDLYSKPVLIDELLSNIEKLESDQCEIGGAWYVAKPLPYYKWTRVLTRAQHAWLVLRGKGLVLQFAEDAYLK
jgi:hypothetical protein